MKKLVIVTHFTMKIIRMYLYINCNKKIFYVSSFRRVVVMIAILLGISPPSGCC